MPEDRTPQSDENQADRAPGTEERFELLEHLQAMLEPVMVGLGLVFLVLLLVDYADAVSSVAAQAWLDRAFVIIWIIFLADFAIRFVVAPSKLRFLQQNWLGALSLALPFLRPLRALRAVRAVRSLRLVRLLGGVNRGMRVLRRVSGGRRLAYVGTLTILVTLAGAVGVLFFDRNAEGATIRSFGDALWWAAAMVTTINNEKYAVSPEARVIAVLIRVFAVSVFGFVTASIASYLVGREAEERAGTGDSNAVASAALREDLAAARLEIAFLRQELRTYRSGEAPMGDAARRDVERGDVAAEPSSNVHAADVTTSGSTPPDGAGRVGANSTRRKRG